MENAQPSKKPPKRTLWGIAFIALFSVAALVYYALLSQKDRTINHDYYRILYEASNTFNENLIKLDSMHVYKESVSSIRSLLPSYKRVTKSKERSYDVKTFNYELNGNTLSVISPKFHAELEFADILPSPKKGFSQYLFADEEGKVLATIGGERTISIVNLSSINQQIQRKNKQFQLSFSDPNLDTNKDNQPKLPTYSNHVDMKISYGDFRVYVFPFSLSTPLRQDAKETAVKRLYLVGLLPQDKLTEQSSGHWNISVLAVTLVSIFFMWNMLRLYLLPKNQSITKTFRITTLVSSYLFYVVIIGLVLAYFQQQVLQQNKDRNAHQYAKQKADALRHDLESVFSSLSEYQPFYSSLISQLESISKDLDEMPLAKDKVDGFNHSLRRGLAQLANSTCPFSKGLLPGNASSTKYVYEIGYRCDADNPNDVVSVSINQQDIAMLANSFAGNLADLPILDFYSADQVVKLVADSSLATAVAAKNASHIDSKLLSVFALNGEGNSVVPSIIFQESNALPTTFNLSHRNYYKMVRDQRGWDLTFHTEQSEQQTSESISFQNVYIQRLLNVNNGTRGTTISMPLSHSSDSNQSSEYIIAADVLLPSMSLANAPPQDFSYMVVDRVTGDVLFHNDTSRSLVENLYFSSQAGVNLSYWLKAGLDQSLGASSNTMSGYYHGQSGRFTFASTPVERWAMVVFYPDDSLQSLMTNQFLYISITFCCIIGLMMALLYGIRQFIWTSALKAKLSLPTKMNIRLVMLVSSVMFSTSYCLFILGHNIEWSEHAEHPYSWSFWLPVVGLTIASFLVYQGCYTLFSYPQAQNQNDTIWQAKHGSKRLLSAILIAVAVHLVYLNKTADAPMRSLEFHYGQLACNWRNHEHQELNSIGLSRYPNSITKNRIDPIDLLPVDSSWVNQLNNIGNRCRQQSTHVNPDDYPTLSSLIGATHTWQWINTYLFDQQQFETSFVDHSFSRKLEIESLMLYATLLIVIIWAWFRFNTQLLWNRLYCPERFLQHIDRISKSLRSMGFESRQQSLVIECDTIKLNGIGLALLLRSKRYAQKGKSQSSDNASQEQPLLVGFEHLYAISPCLKKFAQDNVFLPNLKLNLTRDKNNELLDVQLWDIETCLEKGEFRQLLLDLIMEFKSLTLSGQLNSFTIFAGFHSLQRVKMKDPLALEQSGVLDHAEYLSWAECLMDFVVKVPDSFKHGIDWQFLADEMKTFPELQFLVEHCPPAPSEDDWSCVWKHNEERTVESRWTTINYILLNVEAFYRFKWESCSRAEKLALYNLAKEQRLNPTNTQMIEHLALNGLITVRKGHLDLVNRSFAHFVLNAETSSTLDQLVSHGEAGVWKSYRLPLGILILMIIGGIALTSGESIYIVAASMAGVLGTIASVTNSANLLRGNSHD